jgi:hypothetical protein
MPQNHDQANAEAFFELAPVVCGFEPTLAAEPLREPEWFPHRVFVVAV